MEFTIICASNNDEVLCKNLLASPNIDKHQVIIQRGYTNVCKAYNDTDDRIKNDIVIYIHQDVYLPETFFSQLENSIEKLKDEDWGVLGVAGRKNLEYIGNILDRGTEWGSSIGLPKEVDILDELMLIMKKDSFIFDESIPGHHLFGTDICMISKSNEKKCYGILAYCHHNSQLNHIVPENYFHSVEYIKNKWKHMLPIHTTCSTIK